MDEFWIGIRVANFIILFASFVLMVYKGVLRMALDFKSFNADRFLNLAWVLLACYSIGEVLYLSTPGGPRVIFQLVIAIVQLYVVAFLYGRTPNGDRE